MVESVCLFLGVLVFAVEIVLVEISVVEVAVVVDEVEFAGIIFFSMLAIISVNLFFSNCSEITFCLSEVSSWASDIVW